MLNAVNPGECKAATPVQRAQCGTPRLVLVPCLRPNTHLRTPLPLGARKGTHGAGCHQPRLRRRQYAGRRCRPKSTSSTRGEPDSHTRPML